MTLAPMAWAYVAIAGAWLCGAVLLLARLAICHGVIIRLRRRGEPAPEDVGQRMEVLAARLGAKRPMVVCSAKARSPFLTGLFRPAIVLPSAANDITGSDAVLVHELAHLKRRDHVWNLAARVLCAAAFWHPLLWRLARELEHAADEVCDDHVVRILGQPSAYARQLSDLAERFLPALSEAAAGVGVIRFRSSLGRRVARILDDRRPMILRASIATVAVVAVALLGATIGAGMLGLADAEEPAPPEAEKEGPTAELRTAVREGDLESVKNLLDETPSLVDSQGPILLLSAADKGHGDVVGYLLGSGVDVNPPGALRPLYAAARKGHVEVVRLLLANGAVVNPKERQTPPPLYAAARAGHTQVVRVLLEAGANLSPKKTGGWSPLYPAARRGDRELVELLLDRGAEIDDTDVGRLTALHGVAKGGHVELVEALLARGAEPNLPDDEGRTPLRIAAASSHEAVARLLIDAGANVNAEDDKGRTPMHKSAARGDAGLVRMLIAAGAKVNVSDAEGRTPLHEATISASVFELEPEPIAGRLRARAAAPAPAPPAPAAPGAHCTVIADLLAAGADVNAADNTGTTPLHEAAFKGAKDIVQFLLDRGARVNARDGEGRTPLDRASGKAAPLLLERGGEFATAGQNFVLGAIREGKRDALKLALERGARVKPGYREGWTGLHSAAMAGDKELVERLIAEGADPNAADDRGRSPLDVVRDRPVAAVLLAHGANVRGAALGAAASQGRVDLVQFLLANGADPNWREKSGQGDAPLHWAAEQGHEDVARGLLAAGADPNVAGGDGHTPLHRAVSNGQVRIVEILLAAGADINASPMDRAGRRLTTPLRLAAEQGDKETFELLLARGAKHDAYTAAAAGDVGLVERLLDSAGPPSEPAASRTRLPYVAVKWGHTGVVRLLLDRGLQAGPEVLATAAKAGHRDVVELLLDRGADVNGGEERRMEFLPLISAAREGRSDVVELLIAGGADINAGDGARRTALHWAAAGGHRDVARTLLAAGADVNAVVEPRVRREDYPVGKGNTPLHLAAENGATDVVDLLLEAGADVNALTWEDVSALHLAARARHWEVMARLLKSSAAHDIFTATAAGDAATVERLLDGDPELIRAEAALGRRFHAKGTPLHWAAAWNRRRIANLLLDRGAEVNVLGGPGSPLHIAAEAGHKEVAELLVARGADVNAWNSSLRTPLHSAAQAGHADVVELLLAKGADASARDLDGWAPLELAAREGHEEVIELLRRHGAAQ
jgi:ankyrin repeat protein/beta-lactamase regulating signal transducer with metallopeptidase domain